MAAIGSITAVRTSSDTVVRSVVYGATIAAGQVVYLDSTDNKHKLCDTDLSLAASMLVGVAITPGVDGGYGLIATSGEITLVGTTMAVGETYYAGPTAGSIFPDADIISGNYVSRLGTASAATTIKLSILATGVLHA